MDVSRFLRSSVQLLADRRLAEPQGLGDLALAHAGRHHRAQRQQPTQPCEFSVALGLPVLGEERREGNSLPTSQWRQELTILGSRAGYRPVAWRRN